VAALMGAFAAVHGRQPMRLALVSMLAIAPRISFISLPALVFLGLWLLEQVFWTVISRYMPLAVAFWAHLGGFGFGAVAAFLLKDRLAAGGAA
jgi:membrane associated rhomboid family serine protease